MRKVLKVVGRVLLRLLIAPAMFSGIVLIVSLTWGSTAWMPAPFGGGVHDWEMYILYAVVGLGVLSWALQPLGTLRGGVHPGGPGG
jgi:hypothetical protein